MRIGVDVGGTNTDAVIMDGRNVVAAVKSPTTADVSSGVFNAISDLLQESGVDRGSLHAVMIGTTHFINAFVQRRGLSPVGIIRLCLPACTSVSPAADWPPELREMLGDQIYMVAGGVNFDGRPISELDESAVRKAARSINMAEISSVAVSSVFSPASPEMELRVDEILREEIQNVSVTLSHRVGTIGLLERENAAIINATLHAMSGRVIAGFYDALLKLGIEAPFFVSQNDGTLMNPAFAQDYPIRTFASGATNSMRGAHFLSGEKDAMVADIGGTTTDVGVLVNGYPREASSIVDIGGVRTNFRMPDAICLGLGGGSIVESHGDDGSSPNLTVGPTSVGYEIHERALVFGGDVLTATDIAVAAGQAKIGDNEKVSQLSADLVERATQQMGEMLADTVDRMKVGVGDVPLVLVGGGAVLVAERVAGTSRTVTPDYADVANAVGAAISQVGVEVEHLVTYESVPREQAIESAKLEATEQIVLAGGDPNTVQIVDIEEIQIAYMATQTVRLRVRVVADLLADGIEKLRATGAA